MFLSKLWKRQPWDVNCRPLMFSTCRHWPLRFSTGWRRLRFSTGRRQPWKHHSGLNYSYLALAGSRSFLLVDIDHTDVFYWSTLVDIDQSGRRSTSDVDVRFYWCFHHAQVRAAPPPPRSPAYKFVNHSSFMEIFSCRNYVFEFKYC